MALIKATSHLGIADLQGRQTGSPCLVIYPRSVKSDGCSCRSCCVLQEARTSPTDCCFVVHFRECQTEQGEWRGSLPINIWGALVAAAVYLTQHASGLPWRARCRGADSVTPSLAPLVLLQRLSRTGYFCLPTLTHHNSAVRLPTCHLLWVIWYLCHHVIIHVAFYEWDVFVGW